jgi:hypothetical protein
MILIRVEKKNVGHIVSVDLAEILPGALLSPKKYSKHRTTY